MFLKRLFGKPAGSAAPVDQATLVALATGDGDLVARRDACRRLLDLAVLRRLADADADAGMRDLAAARYQRLLAGQDAHALPLARRLAEIAARGAELGEPLLAMVATQSPEAEARAAAIALLTDADSLAGCALGDALAANRLLAASRLHERAPLERVARGSGKRDKGVYRLARERLKALNEAEARPRRAREEALALCERAARLGRHDNWAQDRAVFDHLDQQWAVIKADLAADPVGHAELAARFDGLRTAFFDGWHAHQQANVDASAARAADARTHAEAAATRERLLAEVAGLGAALEPDARPASGAGAPDVPPAVPPNVPPDVPPAVPPAVPPDGPPAVPPDTPGDAPPDGSIGAAGHAPPETPGALGARLRALEAEWAALPVPAAPGVARDFAAALAAARGRLAAQKSRQRAGQVAARLLADLDALLARGGVPEPRALRALQRRAEALAPDAGAAPDAADPTRAKVEAALRRLTRRLDQHREQIERKLAALPERLRELDALIDAGELRRAEPLFQSAAALLEQAEAAGPGDERAAPSFAAASAELRRIGPRLRELRHWRRWSTDEHRAALCADAEALAAAVRGAAATDAAGAAGVGQGADPSPEPGQDQPDAPIEADLTTAGQARAPAPLSDRSSAPTPTPTQATTLASAPTQAAAARRLHELHQAWRELERTGAPASDLLRARFRAATEPVAAYCAPWQRALAERLAGNRRAREALCTELETFLEQVDWQRVDWKAAARAEREMRQSWAALDAALAADTDADLHPAAEPRHAAPLEGRFRRALRRLDKALGDERGRNLAHKRDLIGRMQALVDEPDLRRALDAAKALQQQWQTTVPGHQREENALWQAFRAATDAVFARRAAEHEARDAEQREHQAARAAICADLTAATRAATGATPGAASGAAGASAALAAALGEQRRRWADTAALPLARPVAAALERTWQAAVEAAEARLAALAAAERRAAGTRLAELADYCDAAALAVVALDGGSTDAGAGADTAADPAGPALALRSRLTDGWARLVGGSAPDATSPDATSVDPAPPDARRLDAALAAAWSEVLAALDDPAARARLATRLATHRADRERLCLHLEIAVGVASPPRLRDERMRLQVERLRGRHGAGGADALADADALLADWYRATPAATDADLTARFARVLDALHAPPPGRSAEPGS